MGHPGPDDSGFPVLRRPRLDASGCGGQCSFNCAGHLVDGDGGQAAAAFGDAGFEVAAKTTDLVIEDAVLVAGGVPDAGKAAGGKGDDAGNAGAGGQVHGARVWAEEDGVASGCGVFEDGGGFAGAEPAAEVDLGARPAGGGEVRDIRVFFGADERESMGGIGGGEPGEEGAPVFLPPVLSLHLGAGSADDERFASEGAERCCRDLFFGWVEAKVPVGEVTDLGVAEGGDGAGEPSGFGFVEAGFRVLDAGELGLHGQADDAVYAAGELEEPLVALDGTRRADGHEVDEDVGLEAADLASEAKEFDGAAGADSIAHVAVDQSGIAEDGCGGWSLGVDGEVGEEAAFGIGIRALDEMKAREGYGGVAETAKAIDQDFLDRRVRGQVVFSSWFSSWLVEAKNKKRAR